MQGHQNFSRGSKALMKCLEEVRAPLLMCERALQRAKLKARMKTRGEKDLLGGVVGVVVEVVEVVWAFAAPVKLR